MTKKSRVYIIDRNRDIRNSGKCLSYYSLTSATYRWGNSDERKRKILTNYSVQIYLTMMIIIIMMIVQRRTTHPNELFHID